MALWARLMVNSQPIGLIDIQRLSLSRPDDDDVASYRVKIRVNGDKHETKIEHRYGDGAITLLRKALEAIE